MTIPALFLPSASPDLTSLLARVQTLITNSKGTLTRSGYRRDFEAYQQFCSSHSLVAVPASESTICLYLAFCSVHLRVATISRRLAAIADGLRSMGEDVSPLRGYLVQQTWKGIRRTLGVAPQGRAPLLASAIREIAMACPDTLLGRRDRSLIMTGFWGGFRRSELAALQLGNLMNHDGNVVIRLRQAKNDPEGAGRSVVLARNERKEICPVTALENWIEVAALASGALYRGVDRHGNVSDGLNPDSIPRILKRAARRAGLPASKHCENRRSQLTCRPCHAVFAEWDQSACSRRDHRPSHSLRREAVLPDRGSHRCGIDDCIEPLIGDAPSLKLRRSGSDVAGWTCVSGRRGRCCPINFRRANRSAGMRGQVSGRLAK